MIQDTAWSPRFVPSTTATAATSGEAIAGTDTTKFITPSLLPAATSYHAGPVVNARAPRQGLVFDGTAGATHSNITLGSGDFTVAVWARVPTTSAANRQLLGSSGGDTALFLDTTGLAKIYISGQTTHTASSVVPDQKSVLIVYTRSGTSGTFYQNAVSNGTVTDSNNYSTAWSYFGARSGGGYTTGTLIPLIYNRALSASEVVALYEAGAPSGADYNSASNTSKLTGANSDFSSAGNWTVTGSTTISGGKLNLSNGDQAYCTPGNISVPVGGKFRVTLTVDSITAGSVQVYTGGIGGWVNIATTAGTFTQEFTFSAASGPTPNLNLKSTGGNAVVDTVLYYQIGLLLAPDAAQAGGGLTWYDTSGNAANITLPASGVSWNVPFGNNIAASGTNQNLTLNASGTGSILLGSNGVARGQIAGVNRNGSIGPASSGTTTNAIWRISNVSNSLVMDIGLSAAASPYPGYIQVSDYSNLATSYPLSLNPNGGNLLIGKTTPDTGEKLQVSGTAAISGGIVGTTTNNSAAAGIVGEIITSTLESGSAVSLTSTVAANVTSISLTAGDWDVTGTVAYSTSGATVTQFLQALNNASASLGPTGSFTKINQSLSSDTDSWFHNAPTYRFSLSATSTVYLIARSYFSAGTVGAYGFIRARRVR